MAFNTKAFMERFTDRFGDEVDSHAIVRKLEMKSVISPGLLHQILGTDTGNGSLILYTHIRDNADLEALHKLCDVMIATAGHQKTKKLGQDMKNSLPSLPGSQPDMGDNQRDSAVQVTKPTSTIQDVLKGEIRKTEGYQKVLRNMVAKHIGLHLDALANNVEVDSGGFVADHPHNKKDAAAALLIHWAEGNTGKTPVWSDLLEAMRESDMAKEANELEEYLRGGST